MNKIHPLKIGKLRIATPLILAPMCDVTCNAFRLLCHEFGAGLTFSEKLEEAKFRMDRSKFDDFLEVERPVGAQVIGSNTAQLKALVGAIGDKADVIDFNAGCSKRRYIARKWGGWFSAHPKELEHVLTNLREATNKPLTVKVRLGKDRESPEVFQILKSCENVGIDAMTVHARFVIHNYLDKADWSQIKKLKDAANIPIIANGDVFSADDAMRAFKETGCDGVMIGRGAMGNPFIFRDAKLAISGKEFPREHALSERIAAFLKFLEYYRKYGGKQNFAELKAHATWFVVAAPGTRKLRVEIQKAKTEEELQHLLCADCA